jgi:hypothetical protein
MKTAADGDGTKFRGTGFQHVKKHGQDDGIPLRDTKFRTVLLTRQGRRAKRDQRWTALSEIAQNL